MVADILRSHYARAAENDESAADFLFDWIYDTEASIVGAHVGLYLRTHRLMLTRWLDVKHTTTDRERSGMRAAIGYADALETAYQDVRAQAVELKLLPATTS